ncbi:MAG TPA: hypothetical protein VFQ68_43095 [Streptosporangiaceae bacterium]|nr:hypothetical protein [Streptosporangiaceae bacterium]
MGFYGRYPWASHPPSTRLAIGGTLLFIGNARVVVNLAKMSNSPVTCPGRQ